MCSSKPASRSGWWAPCQPRRAVSSVRQRFSASAAWFTTDSMSPLRWRRPRSCVSPATVPRMSSSTAQAIAKMSPRSAMSVAPRLARTMVALAIAVAACFAVPRQGPATAAVDAGRQPGHQLGLAAREKRRARHAARQPHPPAPGRAVAARRRRDGRRRLRDAASDAERDPRSGRGAALPVVRQLDGGVPALGARSQGLRSQKSSFIANWIWRAEPASPVGSLVEVTSPKLVLPTVAMRPGCPRFG